MKSQRHIIPLGSLTRVELRELFPTLDAKHEWDVEAGFANEVTCDHDHVSEYKGRGKWRTVQRARHKAIVRSYGIIQRGGKALRVSMGSGKPYTLRAPEGCLWLHDEYGLKVALESSRRDDYHPTPDQFRNWDREDIGLILTQNRDKRLAHEAEEAALKAEAEGVFVCAADSVRDGNCQQGTESWALKHGLDPARHYPAKEVLAKANGDAGRVRLAITAAIKQARVDNGRGYSVLSEHGFPEPEPVIDDSPQGNEAVHSFDDDSIVPNPR